MRRCFAILVLLFGFFLVSPNASAHVLLTDGPVGAVIHIHPDDDPIAGEDAHIHLGFKDRNGEFDFAICNCRIRISEGNRELLSERLLLPSFHYTFPERGLYTIDIEGMASVPFHLRYNLRVERVSASNEKTTHHNHGTFFIYGFAAFLVFWVQMYERGKLSTQKIYE